MELLGQFPFTKTTLLHNKPNHTLIRIQDIKLVPFYKTGYFKKHATKIEGGGAQLEATPRQIAEWLEKIKMTPCNIVTLEQVCSMKKKELKRFNWPVSGSRGIIFLGTTLEKHTPEEEKGQIMCTHLSFMDWKPYFYPGIINYDEHIDVRSYIAFYKP